MNHILRVMFKKTTYAISVDLCLLKTESKYLSNIRENCMMYYAVFSSVLALENLHSMLNI